MGAESDRKSRRRREAEDAANRGMPTIVCTSHGLKHTSNKNTIEVGAIFVMCIFGLYLYGFVGSFQALPEIGTGRQLGENLNVAKLLHDDEIGAANNNAEGLQQHDDEESIDGNNGGKHAGTLQTPASAWPVDWKNELQDFEEMIHPGDLQTILSVPKLWSLPLHNKQFYSREQAMEVGTCIEPDPVTGSYVRGDACPLNKRTIFIAIASYRDFQCRYTAESAFLRAENPERIRVAVVDQIVDGEDAKCDAPIEPCEKNPGQALCMYRDQINVYQIEAELSIGPVFARHLGHRMYRGEYYATQSDAHVTFVKNWDSDIISQMEATHNEMAVLSTYLSDVQGSITEDGISLRKTRPIMCNTYYEGGPQGMHLRHLSQPERMPSIHGSPQLSPWWAAGYSFSRGHFVVNVPYDPLQPMIFQGEEMSIAIRGFTIGYDFYAPERSVCFHHYAVGKNAAIRNKVHHFWDNSQRYANVGKKAMARLLGIVHMNPEVDPSTWDHTDEDVYGLGGSRAAEKFYETYGIDVEKKTTENHLCRFVSAKMHRQFTPHLRPDGMGIDYSKIDFRFVDPDPTNPNRLA